MAAPCRADVLALYRAIVRAATCFPDRSMGRKLQFNARELIRLRRDERDASAVQRHLDDGHLALRVYELLQRDARLLAAITRKPVEQRLEPPSK